MSASRRAPRATSAPSGDSRAPRAATPSPWRWSRRLVISVLVVASLVVGGQWVLHRSFFSVRDVSIRGLVHETDAAVLRETGLSLHPAMIDVNTATIVRRLERFAWIKSATVLKRWPHSIAITVVERRAIAVADTAGGRLVLVDPTGHQLQRVSSAVSLPKLETVSSRAWRTWPYQGWAEPAAQVAAQLPVAFASQVAAVSVNRSGDVSLLMTTPLNFVLGTTSDLHQKFVAVAAVLARPHLLHAGDTVDVSVPGSPTVSGP